VPGGTATRLLAGQRNSFSLYDLRTTVAVRNLGITLLTPPFSRHVAGPAIVVRLRRPLNGTAVF